MSNSFTGQEDHSISLHDAAVLTARYRASHPGGVKGLYYSKAAILDILNQTDCVGIRIYLGEDTNGETNLVLTGVKANQDDLYNGVLAEFGTKCPNVCGVSNPLNT